MLLLFLFHFFRHTNMCLFSQLGRSLSERYIRGFLRKFYPRLPEEWISCIRDRLLSDSELAYVGSHLGITDILQYALDESRFDSSSLLPVINNPPPNGAIATSLLAVVGAVGNDQAWLTDFPFNPRGYFSWSLFMPDLSDLAVSSFIRRRPQTCSSEILYWLGWWT